MIKENLLYFFELLTLDVNVLLQHKTMKLLHIRIANPELLFSAPTNLFVNTGGNHNLCCDFLPILPNLHDLHPRQLVPVQLLWLS